MKSGKIYRIEVGTVVVGAREVPDPASVTVTVIEGGVHKDIPVDELSEVGFTFEPGESRRLRRGRRSGSVGVTIIQRSADEVNHPDDVRRVVDASSGNITLDDVREMFEKFRGER